MKNLFLGKGFGGMPFVKKLSEWYIRFFNPFIVEGSAMYLPEDEIQMAFGGYEKEKIALFKRFIRSGPHISCSTIIDVGAHVGIYALLGALLLKGTGKVYAYEADPRNFELLEKNIKLNNRKNIFAKNLFIGRQTGKQKVYDWQGSRYSRGYGTKEIAEIFTNSLDALHKNEKIDIVKINAPGAENSVIMGMKNVLKNNPSMNLIVQYSPARIRAAGENPRECIELLKSLGFKIYVLNLSKGNLFDDATKELFIHPESTIYDFEYLTT